MLCCAALRCARCCAWVKCAKDNKKNKCAYQLHCFFFFNHHATRALSPRAVTRGLFLRSYSLSATPSDNIRLRYEVSLPPKKKKEGGGNRTIKTMLPSASFEKKLRKHDDDDP